MVDATVAASGVVERADEWLTYINTSIATSANAATLRGAAIYCVRIETADMNTTYRAADILRTRVFVVHMPPQLGGEILKHSRTHSCSLSLSLYRLLILSSFLT